MTSRRDVRRPSADLAMSRPVIERRSATTALVDGVSCVAFAGCDYLGLSQHPAVRQAALDAIARCGTSSGASRATSGTTPLHLELESALAEFLDVEDALVVEDGYVADLAVARGLADSAEAAFVDAESHPSLADAARLSGLEVFPFAGDDLTRAHALLDRHIGGAALVLTDGAFTNSGRLARADHLLRMLPERGTLVVDDSHLLGVLRERGRGTLEVYGLRDTRVVVTASLAKALGASGGVIAGSADRIERIRRRAAPFVATTALNPASTAAAIAAVRLLETEPERVERLTANTGALHRAARRLGLMPRGTFLPVLRLGEVELEDPADATHDPAHTDVETDAARTESVAQDGARDVLGALAQALRSAGLFAPLIRYPGVRGAQLRITVSSEHTSDHLALLERTLADHLTPDVRAT